MPRESTIFWPEEENGSGLKGGKAGQTSSIKMMQEVSPWEVKQVMNRQVIAVSPEEPVSVGGAADDPAQCGGRLPVRDRDGSLCGILTDRDVVTRCVALERPLQETSVARVMTARVATVPPTASLDQAAALLSREQVRRLPVVEGRRLVGMVTLSDLSRQAPAQIPPTCSERSPPISSVL